MADILEGTGARRVDELYEVHLGRLGRPPTRAEILHVMTLLAAEAVTRAQAREREAYLAIARSQGKGV